MNKHFCVFSLTSLWFKICRAKRRDYSVDKWMFDDSHSEEWQSHLWTMTDEDRSFYEDYLCLLRGRRPASPQSDRIVQRFPLFKRAGAYFPHRQSPKYRTLFKEQTSFRTKRCILCQLGQKSNLWFGVRPFCHNIFGLLTIQSTLISSDLEMVLALLTTSLSKHTQQLKHRANMAPKAVHNGTTAH